MALAAFIALDFMADFGMSVRADQDAFREASGKLEGRRLRNDEAIQVLPYRNWSHCCVGNEADVPEQLCNVMQPCGWGLATDQEAARTQSAQDSNEQDCLRAGFGAWWCASSMLRSLCYRLRPRLRVQSRSAGRHPPLLHQCGARKKNSRTCYRMCSSRTETGEKSSCRAPVET